MVACSCWSNKKTRLFSEIPNNFDVKATFYVFDFIGFFDIWPFEGYSGLLISCELINLLLDY